MTDRQDERRVYRRAGMSLLVKFFPIPDGRDSPSAPVPGLTNDLSRFGMSAWVGRAIDTGTRCIVRFFDTENKVSPDMVWGEVKRAEAGDDGHVVGFEFQRPLEFIDLPGMDTELQAADDAGAPGPPTKGAGPRYRVLVVEGDQRIRELLERFLTQKGFDVEAATDGEEALRKVEELRPELLLLDLYLPRMSGLELLRKIRARDCDPGVVCAISGYASEGEAKELFQLGAVDYFPKPLDLGYMAWSLRVRLEATAQSSSPGTSDPEVP